MPTESKTEPQPTRAEALTRYGVIALALLACAVPLSGNNADADLWGHVQYGRDAVRFGLAETTTYSYTAIGHLWINHENLSELTFAWIADAGGGAGLLVFKCLLGVAVCGLMIWRQLRQGVSLLTSAAVTLLVALNLTSFWHVRPQLLSYVYYAAMLWLLDHAFTGWAASWRLDARRRVSESPIDYQSNRMRKLWLAPLLFILWTNSHGAFAAGLAIYGAYLFLRAAEAWVNWRNESWGVIRRLGLMGVVAVLATFLNPYGPNLHSWMIASLGQARPEITEWHPPYFAAPEWAALFATIALFVFAIACTRRSRDFVHVSVLAATLWQTMEHQRHAPFFAIAFGFFMAPQVDSALKRFGVFQDDRFDWQGVSAWMRWALPTAGVAAGIAIGAFVAARCTTMTVKRDEYPVAAMQYIQDEELKGRLVVTYNWAQYALACFGRRSVNDPQPLSVAFDGRFRTCYPQDVVDMHFDFVLGDADHWRCRGHASPPFDPTAVLRHGNPELVLISRRQPHSESIMVRNRDQWTILYQDELAQLWGRRDVFDDSNNDRFIPESRRILTLRPQSGFASWPAMPQRRSAMSRVVQAPTAKEAAQDG